MANCIRCGKPCGNGQTMCDECQAWFQSKTGHSAKPSDSGQSQKNDTANKTNGTQSVTKNQTTKRQRTDEKTPRPNKPAGDATNGNRQKNTGQKPRTAIIIVLIVVAAVILGVIFGVSKFGAGSSSGKGHSSFMEWVRNLLPGGDDEKTEADLSDTDEEEVTENETDAEEEEAEMEETDEEEADEDTEEAEETDEEGDAVVSEAGIHSYELVVCDTDWQSAFSDCISRGGYLVRINSQEEWDYLMNMLNAQRGEAIYFYVGGSRKEDGQSYCWVNEQGDRYGEPLNGSSFWGSSLWLEGEPSYVDGDTQETVMAILYQESANRYVLNDVAGNLPGTSSYLSGKVGYIVEYDTSSVSGAEAIEMSDVRVGASSSSLSERGMTHSADRLLDGDLSKAWVEGAEGQGIGEYVTFTLEDSRTVSGITVWNGYQKSSDLYNKNSRVKELLVTFSDGSQETVKLRDAMGSQSVSFSSPKQTDSLKITIQSVYAGDKYEDTVLSEVEFY